MEDKTKFGLYYQNKNINFMIQIYHATVIKNYTEYNDKKLAMYFYEILKNLNGVTTI